MFTGVPNKQGLPPTVGSISSLFPFPSGILAYHSAEDTHVIIIGSLKSKEHSSRFWKESDESICVLK